MRLKEFVFWILFLALCFAGGYLHGSLPSSYVSQKIIGQESKLRVLFVDTPLNQKKFLDQVDILFDPELVLLERKSLEEVRSSIESSPIPDLALIPLEWAIRFKKENLLQPLIVPVDDLATDFSQTDYFIPALWDIKEDFLKRWVFVAPAGPQNYKEKILFLNLFYQDPIYETLLQLGTYRAVLNRIDKKGWPQDKRASAVRNIPFHLLKTQNEHYNFFN